MALQFASINSGSNGNCYYIGNEHDAVLVDAGISCREIERRMDKQGLDIKKVRAVLISHEHSDHITGLPRLSSRFQIPVYVTNATLKACGLPVETNLVRSFTDNHAFEIASLKVTPFRKFHDAVDPHSFMIDYKGINVGVFTDIGHACKNVIRYFRQCDAVFLESNYCVYMLERSHYPYYLKKRISSDHGHLSNHQALELFLRYRTSRLSHLLLSHLSKNNNSPGVVNEMFNHHAGDTRISVASRYEAGEVFTLSASGSLNMNVISDHISARPVQLQLF